MPFTDDSNRRIYPRRKVTFPMSYTGEGGTSLPAFGLNIGGGGVCVLTQAPLEVRSVEFAANLAGQGLRFVAELRWSHPVPHAEGRFRAGLHLHEIADHDWDAMMRYVLEDPSSIMIGAGSLLSAQQRDSMLAPHKQQQIAHLLIERRRLLDAGAGRLPLIEYAFGGYKMREGIANYVLSVRSKAHGPDDDLIDYHTSVEAAIESDRIRIAD